ncbi:MULTISPECIES: hypothetical protein [unclassified Acinetobacter]|uniref:hypothetical protein n=1 Tax=unclassified Acinetobacter TaxID=196816 RepID=UPI0029350037|nr:MULTISPECIES: hypothetical protein [unclassified Acinetobacter]WOE31795.1 hypothetical protein QSG84_00815 [Acinetobacter sp. SAAs470]WOE37262.1 hypothetical protein QSG86_09860 [Acinetobacter sp. SAAs474]
MLVRILADQQTWRAGLWLKIATKYTNRTDSLCCHAAKENRQTSATCEYVECDFSENADLSALGNILALGYAVLSMAG